MRQILITMLLSLSVLMTAQAAAPQQKAKTRKQLVTVVYQTDIHCDGCARKIMNNVPALGRGVEDVKVDVPTKQVTVTYDAAKTDDQAIIKGLKSIAVQAERIDRAK